MGNKRKVSVKSVTQQTPELPSLFQIQKGQEKQSRETDVFQNLENNLLDPPYPQKDLMQMVEYSTILQQCIEAYRRNIVGFGAEVRYVDDSTVHEPTTEMEQEKLSAESFIKYFNFDDSYEEVWGDAIENREKTGNGYIEIIRNGQGLTAEGYSISPDTMRLTALDKTRVEIVQVIDGVAVTRKRRFRKFAQQLSDGEIIWFKELNDPRYMNSKTGEYTAEYNGEDEATEILHLKLGDKPYGVPRWIGQLIHMYGARKAEELNYNYFYNGRHNPAALIVSNGLLTEESITQLEEYSNNVQGTDNAHKFLVIEVEGTETGIVPGESEPKGVKAEFKSLADMLQQDALFLDYDEASREKVQSSFRIPDIYVGRSRDFNRATADTARAITEEQVFQPERNKLEFVVNNQILRDWNLQHAKIKFLKPEISNVEDLVKILEIANSASAIAPNDIRELVGQYLGKELEPFMQQFGDLPVTIQQQTAQMEAQQASQAQMGTNTPGNQIPVENQLINVLKDIRNEVEVAYGETIDNVRKARTSPQSGK